jgi:pimeloyl-ACP methyl ester carboxylesterase
MANAHTEGEAPIMAWVGLERPAVVFLHGFALDARMWRRQIDVIGQDHRVLTLDLPGFGPQARDVGEVEPAAEIRRAVDAVKLDRVHLVAASYGAAVAVDFALQHPDRVASLVLAGPILLGRRLAVDAWSKCILLANDGDKTTAAEVWLDDPLFETLRHEENLFEEVRQIVLDYSGAHWTGKVTSLWSEPDPMLALAKLEAPALVVSGEADLPSFLGMAEAYAKALPNARREIVKGVGHHVTMEAAPAFNELLRSFLEDAEKPLT